MVRYYILLGSLFGIFLLLAIVEHSANVTDEPEFVFDKVMAAKEFLQMQKMYK